MYASFELQKSVEQIEQLQGLSNQIKKDFNDTSEQVKELSCKISKVKLLLASISKELTILETKLATLGMPILISSRTWSNLLPKRM